AKTSNTIGQFALDFPRKESVCGEHGGRACPSRTLNAVSSTTSNLTCIKESVRAVRMPLNGWPTGGSSVAPQQGQGRKFLATLGGAAAAGPLARRREAKLLPGRGVKLPCLSAQATAWERQRAPVEYFCLYFNVMQTTADQCEQLRTAVWL